MKNFKMLAIGFVAGVACMVTTSAIAANTSVTATVAPDIFFSADGTVVAPPSDQPILNYNDRIYVPVRFAAELTKAEVDWDVVNHKVVITSPKQEVIEKEVIKEVEKIVYVDANDNPNNDKVVYSTLPIKKTESNYTVEVTGVSRQESAQQTRIFLTLDNKNDNPIQLVQDESKLTVDGEEIKYSKLISQWDNEWFNNIENDTEYDGYLLFDMVPEDWMTASLELKVRNNGGSDNETKTIKVNFKK